MRTWLFIVTWATLPAHAEPLPFGLREEQLARVSISWDDFDRLSGGSHAIEWKGDKIRERFDSPQFERPPRRAIVPRARLVGFLRLVESEGFFSLRSKYVDDGVLDGATESLTINLAGRRKSVYVRNASVPAMGRLDRALQAIADRTFAESELPANAHLQFLRLDVKTNAQLEINVGGDGRVEIARRERSQAVRREVQIPRESVIELFRILDAQGFWELEDEYPGGADYRSFTATRDDRKKTVRVRSREVSALEEIERALMALNLK
jgi:hypothetical protein